MSVCQAGASFWQWPHQGAKNLMKTCGRDGVFFCASRGRRRARRFMTLNCHAAFAEALYSDAGASRADVLQAVTILEDVAKTLRRVFGTHHPLTLDALADLERARMRGEDVAAP